MTPYARFLLAVHDQDLDQPVPQAGRSMRRALRDQLIAVYPPDEPLRTRGGERVVAITPKGIGYLRELGLIGTGES